MPASPVAIPVLFAARRPGLVLLIALALAAGSVWLAATRLGVTTDVDGLFAASLPWKQREAELKRLFPQFNNLIVAVIDADIPEEAEATAAGLQQALASSPLFYSARRPDASPFFDREGLLFLEQDTLGDLLNKTIDAQPFLGQLAADPTARGLFAALGLIGIGVERGQAELGPYAEPLRGFDATLRSSLDGRPKPLSWQKLLSGPVAELGGPYRLVLAKPKLDYNELQPGGAATRALREAAAGLEFVKSGAARVRITGSAPLADEEFATAMKGAVAALAGSMALVVVWLALAVRSWRLIVPIVATLLFGLLLTTGFATLSSSPLNLISVAFAVLFVGLAVDFAIQFSVRYRELSTAYPHHPEAALAQTAQRSGGQILVAAAAVAAGFLAFVPTDFSGVAELGLIAGAGMAIAFAATLTVLPAAIVLCRGAGGGFGGEPGLRWAAPLERGIVRFRWAVLGAFALLAAAGAASFPRLGFDSNPLHTKDPDTEAMRTLDDLAANPVTDPYTIDILVPNAAFAKTITAQLSGLPLVAEIVSLDSFVPGDQGAKLALIEDAASLLAATLAPQASPAPVTPADLRLAAHTAQLQLAKALPSLPAGDPLAAVALDLQRLEQAPDPALMAANAALTEFLPEQIGRLRTALEATAVTRADIPPDIMRDWVAPDGRYRVQVSAKPEATGAAGLQKFVAEVQGRVPEAGGSAVTIVETAHTITSAFTRAVVGALVAIVAILALALRRLRDVLLVLAPLLLSALLTLLAAVLLSLQLNFANVIALPLLLGVGVSFNVYFVMSWRDGQRAPLTSPTARGVLFSALTTGTAFGSLALSAHPGTASMGRLLLLSLGCTLLASLAFVPAMLATMTPHEAGTNRQARS